MLDNILLQFIINGLIGAFAQFIGKILHDQYAKYKKRKKLRYKMQPIIDKYNELENEFESINKTNNKLTYDNISRLVIKTLEIIELLQRDRELRHEFEATMDALQKTYFEALQKCKINQEIKYIELDISPLLKSVNIKNDLINSEIKKIIPKQSNELIKLLRNFSSKYQDIKIDDTNNYISKTISQIMQIIKDDKKNYRYLYKGLNFIISMQHTGSNDGNLKIKYTHESYQYIIALYEEWLNELIKDIHNKINRSAPSTRGGNPKILKKIDEMILPKIPSYIIDIMKSNHINICAEHYEPKHNTENN